jgi:hypothetical protein
MSEQLTKEERGSWIAQHHCAGCGNLLGVQERMYSGGVCPYCGLVSNSTICDTINKPVFVRRLNWLERLLRIFQ